MFCKFLVVTWFDRNIVIREVLEPNINSADEGSTCTTDHQAQNKGSAKKQTGFEITETP